MTMHAIVAILASLFLSTQAAVANGIVAAETTRTLFVLETSNELLAGKLIPVGSYADFRALGDVWKAGKTVELSVKGFFENGGSRFTAAPTLDAKGTDVGIEQLDLQHEGFDLVAAPGVTDLGVQQRLLSFCENKGCFAILDVPAE